MNKTYTEEASQERCTDQKKAVYTKKRGELWLWRIFSVLALYVEGATWLVVAIFLLMMLSATPFGIGFPNGGEIRELNTYLAIILVITVLLIAIVLISYPRHGDDPARLPTASVSGLFAGLCVIAIWMIVSLIEQLCSPAGLVFVAISVLFVIPNIAAWRYFYGKSKVGKLIESFALSLTLISLGIAITVAVVGFIYPTSCSCEYCVAQCHISRTE